MTNRFLKWRIIGFLQAGRDLMPGRAHAVGSYRGAQPFFIVGSGRTGTTLLRRILCAGGEVHIPPETALLPIMKLYARYAHLRWNTLVHVILGYFEYRRNFGYTMEPVAERLRIVPKKERTFARILTEIYRYDGEVNGLKSDRWGDKTPDNVRCIPEILRMFPDARFIHSYRDGCDVVASLLKYFWDDPKRCAERWVNHVRTARAFGETNPTIFCEVRYEDLVADPEPVTKALCDFLDLEYDPSMIDFSDEQLGAVHDVLDRPFHQNLKKPISRDSIGKGRNALTAEQRSIIAPIIDSTLKELGYDPVDTT